MGVTSARTAVAILGFGLLTAFASACGSSPAPSASNATTTLPDPVPVLPDPVEAMTQWGACGDAFFWAANGDATIAVTVAVELRARSSETPTTLAFTLPDPAVTVEVQHGRELTEPLCNDVISSDWHVDACITPIEGSGWVELDPHVSDYAGGVHGRIELTGVVATDGTRIGDVAFDSDSIGCYSG